MSAQHGRLDQGKGFAGLAQQAQNRGFAARLLAKLPTVKFRAYWRRARPLSGRTRTARNNLWLSLVLTFVAGAANAGGFLAVQQYTSHMTGIVAHMADSIALGAYHAALSGLGGLLSFIMGSACTAIMIGYARRHRLESEYAMPLLLEAALLMLFGALGARLQALPSLLFIPMTVVLLCFIMGLQNAVVSQLGGAQIRTTHVTGIVTDMGIELGRLLYWNRTDLGDERRKVRANRRHLVMLGALLLCFFVGGVVGAVAFNTIGYVFTAALALILVTLATAPVLLDLRIAWRRWRSVRRRRSPR